MSTPTAGWFVGCVGFVALLAAVMSLANGCPTVELNEREIVYTRCIQGTMRIPWQELRSAEIKYTNVPRSSGSSVQLASVELRMTNRRKILLAPLAEAKELQTAIARMLERSQN